MTRIRPVDAVFLAACLGALALFMWLGSGFTFFNDAWAFIKTAGDWSLDELMRPHNEHWQLLNRLAHKVLMATVGMHSYVPYQLIAVLLHIAIAAGIYTYARRQVHELVALAFGVVFLFLGAGAEDYFMAFQMGYNGAAAAGVWALVILLREPSPRHPWIASLLLVLAVMSMGVSLFFLAAATALIIISPERRRLWWVVLPAFLVYAPWYLIYGSDAVNSLPGLPAVADYVRNGIAHAVGQVSGLGREIGMIIAVLMGIAAVGNLASGDKLRLGLITGATGLLAQYLVTALARADTLPGSFQAGRYVHIAAVFIMIALIGFLSGRQLGRPGERFRLVAVVGAVAVLALSWNLSRAVFIQDRWESKIDQTRASITIMLALGGSPAIPADRGLRVIGGGEVRPVQPGQSTLIPGSTELAAIFDRYGSILEDPLAIRGVAIPPRTMDRAFTDLVADSLRIAPGVIPASLLPIPVEAVIDARSRPDGSCLVLESDGEEPRLRMALPSGAVLYVASDGGGTGEVLLSINGTYGGNGVAFDLEPNGVTAVHLPDIGDEQTILVQYRPTGAGDSRLCLGASPSA